MNKGIDVVSFERTRERRIKGFVVLFEEQEEELFQKEWAVLNELMW